MEAIEVIITTQVGMLLFVVGAVLYSKHRSKQKARHQASPVKVPHKTHRHSHHLSA